MQTFAWTPWGLSMWQDTCKYVSPDDLPKLCWQGGTCVIVGDEHARVTEAAKAANSCHPMTHQSCAGRGGPA